MQCRVVISKDVEVVIVVDAADSDDAVHHQRVRITWPRIV